MKRTALITGASSGIGLELARVHAAHGENLVLVARRADKLQELKAELENSSGISVHVVVQDLSVPGAADAVFAETQRQGITVDHLVNNAGYGVYGMFWQTDREREARMIQLNIITLTELTKLYLPGMMARRYGRILHVASTLAFQPGPTMAVYSAAKAYVLHFSEAIANELKGSGVTVTALCPGATESGFVEAAQMQDSKVVKGQKLPSSRAVAGYGYRAMMRGETVAIHRATNFLQTIAVRLTPRDFATRVTRWVMEPKS